MTNATPHDDDARPALSLIRDIQQGTLSPKNLTSEDRQRCVLHLTSEGYSKAEIAEILQVSERTISRDRESIRQSNALQRDPALPGEMAGQLLAPFFIQST